MSNKQKVSFVNPNFQQGPTEFNAYYLPYSPGILWSYANQFAHISDNFELGNFIWRRDTIKDAINQLKDSKVVGFSTYIWNRNYCNVIARELKKINPEIIIVQGGPEPPVEDKNFFERFPYIDLVVKQEGEISFKRILENVLMREDFINIPGLLVNDNGKNVDTGVSARIENIDEIPSPYLTGVFDDLMRKHPEVRWNVILESNRGCPYQCTFCDWGSLTYNKVKKFDLDRVLDELEWAGKKRTDFISFTDANFGIFPDRDTIIADKLIEIQKTYKSPNAYTFSWAKNQKKEVVEIVRKLIYEGGSRMGLTLSVQSMDDNVLSVIRRRNLDTNKIQEVFELCEEYDIPLYTELILGLPGETHESWKENFYKLYKAGNHTGVTVYQAQLLENAEMNLTQKEEYDIKGSIVYDYLIGSNNEAELEEGINVVVSTRDLPREKMLDCQVWSWFQNTFHINGMTNYTSRFLYKKYGIEYSDFYDKLFLKVQKNDWLKSEIDRVRQAYENWTIAGKIDHPLEQGIAIHGWNIIHSTMIMIHSRDKHGDIFAFLRKFVKENYDLPEDIYEDLMTLQETYFINYSELKQYPKKIKFNNDILGYLLHDKELSDPTEYEFEFPEDKNSSLMKYCEQIYMARRRNYGKAMITRK